MRPYYFKFLAWNCIPFHLHRPGEALTNRTPTLAEIDRWLPFLEGLVALLAPQQVIAVGRNAERALARLGVTPLGVRHPAHGGAKAFQTGMETAMNPRAETQIQRAVGQV
jgi:uracil-DNA glycosylase